MACAKIQECVLDVFTDEGDITVTVVSMTRDDVMDTSKVGWSASADGSAVTLTGMASTWDKDRKNDRNEAVPGHAPVTVKLKATDMGELSTEVSVLVAVNGPPTLSEGAAGVGRSAKTKVGEEVSLSTVPLGLFTDPEDPDGSRTLCSASSRRISRLPPPMPNDTVGTDGSARGLRSDRYRPRYGNDHADGDVECSRPAAESEHRVHRKGGITPVPLSGHVPSRRGISSAAFFCLRPAWALARR